MVCQKLYIILLLYLYNYKNSQNSHYTCPFKNHKGGDLLDLILFDYDYCLMDSGPIFAQSSKELMDKYGIKPIQGIAEEELNGLCGAKYLEILAKQNNLSPEELGRVDHEHILKFCRNKPIRYRGFLLKLQNRGVKFGIITGNYRELVAKVVLNERNNRIIFGHIYGLEDKTFPGECKSALIHRACRDFGIDESRTAYVGDHPNDIRAALKAGVFPVAVTTGSYSKAEFKKLFPGDAFVIIEKQEFLKMEFVNL